MQWDVFYANYINWAPSTVATRISSLEDIGDGCEVADVVCNLYDEQLSARLIRKAMSLGVRFSREEYDSLWFFLPQELYQQLGYYTGYAFPQEITDVQPPPKPRRKKSAVGLALLLGSVIGIFKGLRSFLRKYK